MPDSRALKKMMMMGKAVMDDVMSTGKKIMREYKHGKQNERDMFGTKKRMPKK